MRPLVPHPYWTFERVARALGTGPVSNEVLGGVSTDTRTLQQGDVFVALRGDRFDAHSMLEAARDAGAAAFVISDARAGAELGVPCFVVNDTLTALGALATAWRDAWGKCVVAVAGSNGKTTTKDLIAAALSPLLTVHATRGNMNNLVGVPLSLLSLPSHADVAVIEVGTNAPGEVARLRAIAKPDVAVVTSIGDEHLEGLGDLAGVLREECEVFDGATLAVVPGQFPDVARLASGKARAVVSAGLGDVDVAPSDWGLNADGRVWIVYDGVKFELQLRGAHQAANAMLALAVARACGVGAAQAAHGMSAMPVPSMRGEWEVLGDAVLINDAYNANPPSMLAAIALLSVVGDMGPNDGDESASAGDEAGQSKRARRRQRVAILGSMRELGAHSHTKHLEVAKAALDSPVDIIAGVGEFASALQELAHGDDRVVVADDPELLWKLLRPRLEKNACILLKASRGVRLEQMLPKLNAWANA